MTKPSRPVDAKLRAQFESELATGLPSSPHVSGRLQDATCKLVDELKARGFSIEEVIIAMHETLPSQACGTSEICMILVEVK